jgi:hypothetical protein
MRKAVVWSTFVAVGVIITGLYIYVQHANKQMPHQGVSGGADAKGTNDTPLLSDELFRCTTIN